MNVFHWHLTDDQGWRIEIGKYPRLTEVGAWRRGSSLLRAAGKERYGGFYSQADVREIVDFAAARHVTIVPEIEMPGHSQAAIAAYPERGCTGEAVEVLMQMGVSPFLYNVEEETFAFLEDVLSEVMELFPGPYIHIGGDEAIKDQWRASPRVQERMRELAVADEDALQSYFIERIGRFLNQRGRKLVGWDEILEGGLPADATVMSWRGFDGGIAAARLGHDVVMTPYSHCYLDHYQGDPDLEAPALGRPIPLRTAYDFEPLPPQLTAAQAGRVLGGQGNLWTEFVESTEHAEYMAFPRACALAEVLWSPASSRDWPDFARRLEIHLERLRRSGIGFSRSAYQVTFRSDETGEEDRFRITMTNELGKTDLRYTTDESDPTSASHRYLEPLEVSAPATIKAAVFDGPRRIGAVSPLRVASCWSETIDAARFDRTDRAMTVAVALDQAEAGERQLVVGFAGCYVAYDRVDLSGVERVVAEVGVAPEHTRGGSIELRLGKTRGPLLACLPVPVPVDDRGFVRIEAAVAAAAGVQRLCVLFRNEEAGENDLVALLASLRLVRADKS
jgi:hexosaminidase